MLILEFSANRYMYLSTLNNKFLEECFFFCFCKILPKFFYAIVISKLIVESANSSQFNRGVSVLS